MKSLLKAIVALTLLSCINTSYAEDSNTENLRQYDIEVIIFEDAHARYIDSELWPDNNSVIEPDSATPTPDTVSSKVKSSNPKPSEAEALKNREDLFKEIPSDSSKFTIQSIKPEILTKQYNGLKRSSEYTLLFRSAWRQVGLAKNEAFEIDIDLLDNTHKSRSENTITGTLKVVLARYLHFYSQLEYKRKNEAFADEGKTAESSTDGLAADEEQNIKLVTENNTFKIQSHRRMRSKELHYIDHPLLGILVQINRAEIKPVPVDANSTETKPAAVLPDSNVKSQDN